LCVPNTHGENLHWVQIGIGTEQDIISTF
jgi:hypothetical protein